MLEVIHISDTHFGPDRSLDIRGANACAHAEALVKAVNELAFQPDFIVHTGDVANDPHDKAYALAEEILSELKAPVYYATGNHDDVSMMRSALSFGDRVDLVPDSDNQMCYRIGGAAEEKVQFYVLDGWVPPTEGPHGFLSENQIEAVLSDISGEKPVAVFLHYPLVPIGSPWIDEKLLTKNGIEFQTRLLDAAGSQLRGVFTGHLHRGLKLFHDGVFHSGVSSPACEFTAGPEDEFCDFLQGGPIPFDHITFTEESTMVKSYSLPFEGGE
ncbi:MAG: metallophosphoesterase [Verrucomicrobiales bacterium]|nr:metallophosphoesterase [Verrucomicrobiales bacterium]